MQDQVESSTRRIVLRAALLLVPVFALAAATPWVLDRLRPGAGRTAPARPDRPPTDQEIRHFRQAEEKLADAEKRWEGSTAIAAQDAVADGSGERLRWFQGFGISVESRPAGATVLVDGQERGETPLTTSVVCEPGQVVQVEVRAAGHRAQRRTTRCRQDQLVELSVELR